MDTLFLVIDPSTTDGDDTEALLRRKFSRAVGAPERTGAGGLEALAEARMVPTRSSCPSKCRT
ncbi:MAG: hypothetical protein U5Q44_03050 [Dehalococcoidia bacterium]|nr:hypothetical protein [Dehalococcoidia bacterium]